MNYIIETQDLNFSYAKNESLIKNLFIKVPDKSIYGFLGPNGAGKTTSIRIILGLLNAQNGNVKIFCKDFANNRKKILNRIGGLVEDAVFYSHLNAIENLKIFSAYRNIPATRINEVLEIVKLTDAAKKQVKKYSTGMKQRLGIALALLPDPDLIILDEPTNGLDPKGMIEIRELIIYLNKEFGKTIMLSSRLLNEVEKTCNHVGIITKGEMIYQGSVDELKNRDKGKLIVEFETNNLEKSSEILKSINLDLIANSHTFRVNLKAKQDINIVIDILRKNQIEIYKINTVNNLEELFISLTEKEK